MTFHAAAIGRDGGASYRRGKPLASAELRLDGSDSWLVARGEIRNDTPWLVVRLGDHILYDDVWPGEEPESIDSPEQEEAPKAEVIDLMKALKASLAASKPKGDR
jgi:hypothetical protein